MSTSKKIILLSLSILIVIYTFYLNKITVGVFNETDSKIFMKVNIGGSEVFKDSVSTTYIAPNEIFLNNDFSLTSRKIDIYINGERFEYNISSIIPVWLYLTIDRDENGFNVSYKKQRFRKIMFN